MRTFRRLAASTALLLVVLAGPAPAASSGHVAGSAIIRNRAVAGTLSVMSYNIEGLPAPVRFDRARSLARIGEQLAEMRHQGREPNVVLLQEAFATSAKDIAVEAGYRFVADGPSEDSINDAPPPLAALGFVADASHLRGEDDGKWADSGLRILSDYPIVKVERLAFPAWDCAGYDCLANKGALIAWIAVPGRTSPAAFIDTHLNSRAASGVAKARADIAYGYQVSALRHFIAERVPQADPAFLGGDFNSGKAGVRQAELNGGLLAGARNSLLEALGDTDAIAVKERTDSQAILHRAKDWLYYRGTSSWPVSLAGFEVPFGENGHAAMLSDHMGYEVHYRLGRAPRASGAGAV